MNTKGPKIGFSASVTRRRPFKGGAIKVDGGAARQDNVKMMLRQSRRYGDAMALKGPQWP